MSLYLASLYATYFTYSPYVISSLQNSHFTMLKSSESSAGLLQSGHTIFNDDSIRSQTNKF